MAITADSGGLIKTWDGETGQEVGSFPTASSHCSFLQYNIDNAWFLSVRRFRTDITLWEHLSNTCCFLVFQAGTGQGSVCTLEDSTLTKKSSIMVCDSFKVNVLLVSPDRRWIAAGTKDHSDFSPKVFTSVRLWRSGVFLFITSLSLTQRNPEDKRC